jgi:hypothetical protein
MTTTSIFLLVVVNVTYLKIKNKFVVIYEFRSSYVFIKILSQDCYNNSFKNFNRKP